MHCPSFKGCSWGPKSILFKLQSCCRLRKGKVLLKGFRVMRGLPLAWRALCCRGKSRDWRHWFFFGVFRKTILRLTYMAILFIILPKYFKCILQYVLFTFGPFLWNDVLPICRRKRLSFSFWVEINKFQPLGNRKLNRKFGLAPFFSK